MTRGRSRDGKERDLGRFLLYGYLYVGTQEFWVSVIWRQDVVSFILAVLITETLFLSFAYYAGRAMEAVLPRAAVEVMAYLVFGLVGLATIEWYFMGHLPGATTANQFVMFTTWGGAVVFARMQTDGSTSRRLQRVALRAFVGLAVAGTGAGLVLMFLNPSLSFAVTYLAANLGYPLMNVVFVAFFIQKLRGASVPA